MDDAQIIELFFRRSQDAVSETDAKYGKLLRSVSENILRSEQDSEEAVSDAYFALWSSIPPKKPTHFRAFSVGVLRNICLTRLRSSKKERDAGHVVIDELEDVLGDGTSIDDDIQRRELFDAVNSFVETLSGDERRIFVSRYWLFAPAGRIAERLGCTESKVYTSLSRTRNKLKNYMEREGLL